MADQDRSPVAGSAGEPVRRPLTPSAQLDELLDNPRAPELVRSMPSVQLHRLVAMVGRNDSGDLLALASPQQIRELFDLELWEGDRLLVDDAYDWLELLCSLPDAVRHRGLKALDVELLGAVLLDRARFHVIEDPGSDWTPEPGAPLLRTPDGWFAVEVLEENPAARQQLRALIEELYQDDPEGTRRLLHNLVGELPTELEELSYRWRNGRLQDLGFADPEDALLIYAYLDPRSVSPGEGSADRPLRSDPESAGQTELVQILPAADSFWQRALQRLEDDDERHRLTVALMALSNRAIAADRIHPSDLQGIQRSLEGLLWRLSLGLEHLCQGDPARAPEVLAGVALLRIARVGHSLALEARRQLQAATRQGRLGSGPGRIDRVDPPLSLQLSALLASRPGYYVLAERAARPFRDRAELREAEGWIASAVAAADLVQGLELPEPWPERLSFGDLYRTALVNRLLERQGPLDASALARFIREQVRTGQLDQALASLPAQSQQTSPLAARWVERWLRDLQEQVGRLDPDHLDLRFIEGFWLAR